MVAVSGRGWRLAPSLVALFAQADKRFPKRSRASDGSIGDLAHSQRTSDHNIAGGFVHAGDITYDPVYFDAHAWIRQWVKTGDKRIKYAISNRQIWYPGRGWIAYSGENPHNHHVHVSIYHTTAARNDVGPWFTGTIIIVDPDSSIPNTTSPEEDLLCLLL